MSDSTDFDRAGSAEPLQGVLRAVLLADLEIDRSNTVLAQVGYTTLRIAKDWTSWRFWQHSNSGDVSGSGSKSTDLNWFAGTYEDLLAYAGKEQQPPPEPIAPWRLRVVIPKLNVRSGPGRTYKDLGDLHAGDMIEVLALAGKDVWVEFEPGKWAAFSLDDDEPYLEPAP